MSGLSLENYTDKCIVVRGDSRNYVQELTDLGGKYTNILKKGDKVGWIFSKKHQEKLKKFIEQMDVNPKTGNTIVKTYVNSSSSSKTEDEKINSIIDGYKKLNKKQKLLFMSECFKIIAEDENIQQVKEKRVESEIVVDYDSDGYDSEPSPIKKSLLRK
jgi:hypothetical protein